MKINFGIIVILLILAINTNAQFKEKVISNANCADTEKFEYYFFLDNSILIKKSGILPFVQWGKCYEKDDKIYCRIQKQWFAQCNDKLKSDEKCNKYRAVYIEMDSIIMIPISPDIFYFDESNSSDLNNQIIKVIEKKPHFSAIEKETALMLEQTDSLIQFIYSLRLSITEASGGIYSTKSSIDRWGENGYILITETAESKLNGKPIGYKNTEVPNDIFIKQGKGELLKQKMLDYGLNLIKSIYSIAEILEKNAVEKILIDSNEIQNLCLELALEAPDDRVWKDAGKASWSDHIFSYMPVASCYPLLRKFENDVENSARKVLAFFIVKIYNQNNCLSIFTNRYFKSEPYPVLKNEFKGRYPYSTHFILKNEDLKGISKHELKIIRDEIYARYGYIFKDKNTLIYFQSKSGYKAVLNNVDLFLSPIEKENIDFLNSLLKDKNRK